jgi:DNA-binding SARP family transcriptional activator/tetratricopeptide (TPR) repeat protein/TolB-like protein
VTVPRDSLPRSAESAPPTVVLSALGRIDLRIGDDPVDPVLAQPKRLALLCWLHLARPVGPRARETLLATFWPEHSERRARQALNQALAFLRRALGDDVVLSRGRTAVEVAAARFLSDVSAFEAALEAGRRRDALRHYGGDLLPGFHVRATPDFEDWLEVERARLKGTALRTSRALIAEISRDALPDALRWSRWARTLDPLDEGLMDARLGLLGCAGDPTALRQEFRGYTDALHAAAGASPSPALAARFRSALEGAVRADRPPVREAPPGTPDGPPLPGGVRLAPRVAPSAEAIAPPARRRFRPLAVGAAAVALLGFAWAVAGPDRDDGPPLDPRTVFVHPLEGAAEDSLLGRLARMAGDWVARDLARSGVVAVVAPGAAGLPASPTLAGDAVERARAAGAGLLVRGALTDDGDAIRLDAEVMDTRTGRIVAHARPVSVDKREPAAGLVRFRDGVTAAVAVAADPALGRWASTVRAPPDYAAYVAFVDGLAELGAGRGGEAADHFLLAASRDSTFLTPRIWAVRALVYAGRRRDADSLARSLVPLRPAMAGWDRAMLDYYRAYLWGGWEDAYRAAARVVAIAPDPEWRHLLAGAAQATSRPYEALEILEELSSDEGWLRSGPYRWRLFAFVLHDLGRYEEELSVTSRFRDKTPFAAATGSLGAYAALGRRTEFEATLAELLERAGDRPADAVGVLRNAGHELRAHGDSAFARSLHERALARLDSTGAGSDPTAASLLKAETLTDLERYVEAYDILRGLDDFGTLPDDEATFRIGLAAAHVGRVDEARSIAMDLIDADPANGGYRTALSARILAAMGDRSGATARLELAFAQGYGHFYWLHTVPELQVLRDYPPFERLMAPRDGPPGRDAARSG